jgi:uncharacterized Zn-binding protein involved in type VI secretion
MADAAIQTSAFSHLGSMKVNSWSAKTKNAAGKFLVRDGDLFNCDTHGTDKVVTGTASIAKDLDGKTFAKLGDTASCGASIISGDPNIQLS